ncbi:MAG TPA: hypothetical protein VHT68_25755 [Pseudolabrys sp.]|nr:hypothetical protein [Pseudolabrys sp.]
MIESIMYFGIGFLLACLIGVIVIPLIHTRAVRLTVRRLEDSIPQSMAEIQADKDALRAEFAVSTRRLEMRVEQLQNKSANQLAELGTKSDAINQLKLKREAQKVEVVALKSEVNALRERLTAAGKEAAVPEGGHHGPDVPSLVPRAWPTAEPVRVPMDSLQGLPFDVHEGVLVSLVPSESPKPEGVPSSEPAHDLNAGRDFGTARAGGDFSAGSQVVEHVPLRTSGHQYLSNRPWIGTRASRSVALFLITFLIGGAAAFAWQSHGEKADAMVRKWVSSLGSLLPPRSSPDVNVAAPDGKALPRDAAVPQPASTPEAAPAPTAAATSPERSAEQIATEQETSDNITRLQAVEPDIQKSTPFPSLQKGTQPTPETKPTAIEDWTLREVTNGTAVLEGPNGILRATPGDTVPGVGKIESYIRSNGRWIIVTSSGLIPMRVRENTSSSATQNDPQRMPTPEPNPKGIAGWTLREVINGTAVLHGPNGISKVTPGDTVPDLGRVDSIVRWGNSWIVATSRGYCKSSPPHADQDGICQLYHGH